ncbi:hypothetical protein T4A_4728 [Trichinella pseudospiralis]|uniref:Uncharacterized protein n=1 Tax=Trichinella pseudospiralis TaxID=6337 RepID=A0A0V1E7B2_TRIPS|nr:hypothetical protein T4A_4728 [Trichinella pseudospiralis]
MQSLSRYEDVNGNGLSDYLTAITSELKLTVFGSVKSQLMTGKFPMQFDTKLCITVGFQCENMSMKKVQILLEMFCRFSQNRHVYRLDILKFSRKNFLSVLVMSSVNFILGPNLWGNCDCRPAALRLHPIMLNED